jgi:hypothetical protein
MALKWFSRIVSNGTLDALWHQDWFSVKAAVS